jgi:hypothetical protein
VYEMTKMRMDIFIFIGLIRIPFLIRKDLLSGNGKMMCQASTTQY